MLDNLINDIYALVGGKKPPAIAKEEQKTSVSFSKWFDDAKVRKPNTLYFSEIGASCVRQLWYKVHTPEASTPLEPQTQLKFLYGDILEDMVLNVVKAAGYSVTDEQQPVEFAVSDWTIRGRIDACINGVLIDVKSTTKLGQKKFEEGLKDDPFGYKYQLGGYGYVLNHNKAAFLTIQKELGHLGLYFIDEKVIKEWPEKASAVVENLKKPLDSLERLEPVKQSTTSDNLKLCTTCSYCDFKKECWKDANNGEGLKMFLYANRPEFLVKVVKQPKVQEVL